MYIKMIHGSHAVSVCYLNCFDKWMGREREGSQVNKKRENVVLSSIERRNTMAQGEYQNIDRDDYLTLDQNSQNARYEYLEGELRMLVGGSADHSTITTNLTGILYGLLRDGPCPLYNSEMQLQLSESRYVYPDVTVTCDPRDEAPEDTKHIILPWLSKYFLQALKPLIEGRNFSTTRRTQPYKII